VESARIPFLLVKNLETFNYPVVKEHEWKIKETCPDHPASKKQKITLTGTSAFLMDSFL
jgi:hypothetical protein